MTFLPLFLLPLLHKFLILSIGDIVEQKENGVKL